MREENVIALKEIFVNEIRTSMRELIADKSNAIEIMKSIEVGSNAKSSITESFKNLCGLFDDEVLGVVNEIFEEIEDSVVLTEEDEYWGT